MSENLENENEWFSAEVAGLVEEIMKMNLKNYEKLSEKLEVLSQSPLLLFPLTSADNDKVDDELIGGKDFPETLELPDDVTEEAVERVLVTCSANTLGNPHKTIDLMTSPRLMYWGIIRRSDSKLVLQFLLRKTTTAVRTPRRQVTYRRGVLKTRQKANLTVTFNETMDMDISGSIMMANNTFNF